MNSFNHAVSHIEYLALTYFSRINLSNLRRFFEIFGAYSGLYDIAYPWSWMWIKNHVHDWCEGQVGNGPAFTNPYEFSFMSTPHVRTNVIVYDSVAV